MDIDLPLVDPDIDQRLEGLDDAPVKSAVIACDYFWKAHPFGNDDAQQMHSLLGSRPIRESRQDLGKDVSSITISAFVERTFAECHIELSLHGRMEHDRFFGKVAVKRRLGDLRLSGDVVNAGARVPVSKKNDRRAIAHFFELAALLRGSCFSQLIVKCHRSLP